MWVTVLFDDLPEEEQEKILDTKMSEILKSVGGEVLRPHAVDKTIGTVRDALRIGPDEITNRRWFGMKSYLRLRRWLGERGIPFERAELTTYRQ